MKLLQIHIPRTAGTSIQNTHITVKSFGHACANDIGSIINDYYSFTFVRNPYDRFLSAYYYICNVYKGRRKNVRDYVRSYKNFKDFVMNFDTFEYKDDIHFAIPQHKFISKDVDYIGRFEMLDFDWKIIVYTACGIMPKDLQTHNASKHKPWEYEYDKEMRNVIYNLYKKDFEDFSYEP